MADVVVVFEKIFNTIDRGFVKMNNSISALEGSEGIQGINTKLSIIRNELNKMQMHYSNL